MIHQVINSPSVQKQTQTGPQRKNPMARSFAQLGTMRFVSSSKFLVFREKSKREVVSYDKVEWNENGKIKVFWAGAFIC